MNSDEASFHDRWANTINLSSVMVNQTFEAVTAPENQYILTQLGDISGKKLLELGCGAGEASVYFAKKKAIVTATDISSGMLKLVNQLAESHGVKLETVQSVSHQLAFEDNTFDIVYAANLLHHVDIESTLIEVKRVLKTGGVFVSWDPIAHNPIINIYRKIASKVRTKTEHPLKMSDLNLFKQYFSEVHYKTFWLTTLWIFIQFFIIEHVNPNKERYWKKILLEEDRLKKTFLRLSRLDHYLLEKFTFMQKFCWNIAVVCHNE